MEDFAKKQSGESYVDYFVRLFDNKKIYGLTCDQIAELLNTESGQTLGESAYRKEFAAFNRGRNYEREIAERGVATRVLSISYSSTEIYLIVSRYPNSRSRIAYRVSRNWLRVGSTL